MTRLTVKKETSAAKKMMISLFIVTCLMGIEQAFAAQGKYVALKNRIQVEGELITMGDIFLDAGHASDVVIAQSPEPGHRFTLSARHIASLTKANGLYWRNVGRVDRVTISRASRIIPTSTILEELALTLRDHGASEKIDIQLSERQFAFHVAVDAPTDIEILDVAYDSTNGQFQAYVKAVAEDRSAPKRLTGRAYPAIEVPTLMETVQRGDLITASDVQWRMMRIDRVGRNIITEESDLIGKEAKRTLVAGKLLRNADVRTPILVEKGHLITIRYASSNMSLSVGGRALRNGGMGEVIQVVNTRSNRSLFAKVVGPNQVVVAPNDLVQLSAK